MTNYLDNLYKIFYADRYDDYDEISEKYIAEREIFQKIYQTLGIATFLSGNPMKQLLNYIYLKDDIETLKRMLNTKDTIEAGDHFEFDYDIKPSYFDFESEDTSDDGDELGGIYEEAYGKTGTNYYHVNTNKYLHIFSTSTPFSDGLFYHYSELIQ